MSGMDVKKTLGAGAAIAEETRGKEKLDGLMADLFRGKLRLDYLLASRKKRTHLESRDALLGMLLKLERFFLEEYRIAEKERRDWFSSHEDLTGFSTERLHPREVERTNEIPPRVIKWFCDNGYFGLKLPEEYGGQAFKQSEYMRILQLSASWSGSITALLSASNTIGVGWPIMAYGSLEQKEKWLPIVSQSPSGFAFTEEKAGSDPSSMETYAVRVKKVYDSGEEEVVGYEISGRKWWTTNGPKNDKEYLAPVIIVIAKIVDHPDELKDLNHKPNFGAFIVRSESIGVKVAQRCDFVNLKGIYNGITDFEKVYAPKDYLLGKKERGGKTIYYQEGDGFRIALQALNSGRITLAGACAAAAKNGISVGSWWGNERFQWGKLIGKHEFVGSGVLAKNLADTFALESMVLYAASQADNREDCRMEAATCKVMASEKAFEISDNLVQIRGGRGLETAESLEKRGEIGIPVETWWRDARANRIFEGESGVLLRLFTVREGLNDYKEKGDVFFEESRWWKKFKTAVGFGKDLALLSLPRGLDKELLRQFVPELHGHLKFVHKNARRLAKTIIKISGKDQVIRLIGKMLKKISHPLAQAFNRLTGNKPALPNQQLTMVRLFNIVAELYAMATTCACASTDRCFVRVADLYCKDAKIRVKREFASLYENSDAEAREVAKELLEGHYDLWLESGIMPTVKVMENTQSKIMDEVLRNG